MRKVKMYKKISDEIQSCHRSINIYIKFKMISFPKKENGREYLFIPRSFITRLEFVRSISNKSYRIHRR